MQLLKSGGYCKNTVSFYFQPSNNFFSRLDNHIWVLGSNTDIPQNSYMVDISKEVDDTL